MTQRLAYSDKEAAHLTSLSVRSIVYLRRTGKLGFSKVGRRILIPHAELEKLLKRSFVKPNGALDTDELIRPRSQHNNGTKGPASVPSNLLNAPGEDIDDDNRT